MHACMAGCTTDFFCLWSSRKPAKSREGILSVMCTCQRELGLALTVCWGWVWLPGLQAAVLRVLTLPEEHNDPLLNIYRLICLLSNMFQGVINSWKLLLCFSQGSVKGKEATVLDNELSVNFDLWLSLMAVRIPEKQAVTVSQILFVPFFHLLSYSAHAIACSIIYSDFLRCHSRSCMATLDVYFSSAVSSPFHIPCPVPVVVLLSWNVDLHLCIVMADEKATMAVTIVIVFNVHHVWRKGKDGEHRKLTAFGGAAPQQLGVPRFSEHKISRIGFLVFYDVIKAVGRIFRCREVLSSFPRHQKPWRWALCRIFSCQVLLGWRLSMLPKAVKLSGICVERIMCKLMFSDNWIEGSSGFFGVTYRMLMFSVTDVFGN